MTEAITYYRLFFEVAGSATPVFADTLGGFCDAVTEFEDPEDPSAPWTVEAFSTNHFDKDQVDVALKLAAAAAGVEVPKVEYEVLAPRDWVTENLASFTPIEVGRFFVHGSHFDDQLPHGKISLEVDAGLAFGSGEHQTTKGCLMALDRLAKKRRYDRPLDMGCGSGILGLACAKMWKTPVMMADIDPLSVKVARVNARGNRLHPFVTALHSDGFQDARISHAGPYDMILANILARPLRHMAGHIAGNLTDDGVAVLSGLLVSQEQFVLSAYREYGLRLIDRIRVDSWLALVVGR